jgi:hypothetical protein
MSEEENVTVLPDSSSGDDSSRENASFTSVAGGDDVSGQF